MNSAAGGLLASVIKKQIEKTNPVYLFPDSATTAQVKSPGAQKIDFLTQFPRTQPYLVTLLNSSRMYHPDYPLFSIVKIEFPNHDCIDAALEIYNITSCIMSDIISNN